MKIDSSDVILSSARLFNSEYTRDERLRVWKGDTRPDFEGIERGDKKVILSGLRHDAVTLSEQARAAASSVLGQSAQSSLTPISSPTAEDEAKVVMMEIMLSQITGKKVKIRILDPRDMQIDPESRMALEQAQKAAARVEAASRGQERVGWGLEYDLHERFEESETTTFSAEALIRTEDGREIQVSITLTMSRQFIEENNVSIRKGDAVRKDPLVINFSGTAAQLTTDKFDFDIDSDGTADRISFLSGGSGFLAVDRNADGAINDGAELFGATTGDGFGELAVHDEDGNQWIDENDAIFSSLRVWQKSEDGADHLLALSATGVGAIYLGNVSTQFAINELSNNDSLGEIQSTGFWLGDSGSAGTIQHIDLTI